MFFGTVLNSGGIDVLERVVQFTVQRQRLVANNIANLTTPGFRPTDIDPKSFQQALADAVNRRRGSHHGRWQQLRPRDTRHVAFGRNGISVKPRPVEHNIMFHDGNDRDLERTMQDLVENVMVHRQAVELLRSRFALIEKAIRGRS